MPHDAPTLDLVDSHCHLAFGAFDPDRPEVVARAREAGVHGCLVVAVDGPSAEAALRVTREHPGWARATAGIHPTEPAVADPRAFAALRERLASGDFAAVGETGLDEFHRETRLEDQVASLQRHLQAAVELDLPAVIHCRDAFPRLLSELERWRGSGLRGVVHCFSGGPAELATLLDLGLHVGLGGTVTYKANRDLRAAVRDVPPDRLLLETDAPWLAPVPWRGRRNEPAHVAHVARCLADDRGADPAAFARATSRAARTLLRLPG